MDFFILWLIISTVFVAGRILADMGRYREKGRIRTNFNLIALAMNAYEAAGTELHEKLQQSQQSPTQKAIAARRKEIEQLKQEAQYFKELEQLDREYETLVERVERVESGVFPGSTSEEPKQQEQRLHRGADPLPHFRREISLGRDPQIRTGSLRPDLQEKALKAKMDAVNDRIRAEINARIYGAPYRSANYCPECKWSYHGHACTCSLTRNEMRHTPTIPDDPWVFCLDCLRYYSGAACSCGMSRDDRRLAAFEGPELIYADGRLVLVGSGQAVDEATAEEAAEEAAFHRYRRSTREEWMK